MPTHLIQIALFVVHQFYQIQIAVHDKKSYIVGAARDFGNAGARNVHEPAVGHLAKMPDGAKRPATTIGQHQAAAGDIAPVEGAILPAVCQTIESIGDTATLSIPFLLLIEPPWTFGRASDQLAVRLRSCR